MPKKISGLTQETTFDDADSFVFSDSSAGADKRIAGSDLRKKEAAFAVDSVSSLLSLTQADFSTGDKVEVQNFKAGINGGGGLVYWDASESQANHNGGSIIDPGHSVTPGSAGWWTAENTGTGCWKRSNYIVTNLLDFGLDGSDTAGVNSEGKEAALTYAKNNNKLIYVPPGHTFQLEDGGFALDSSHNGLSIIGGGPTSVLKLADSGSFGNGAHQLIYIDCRTETIKDIHIGNLALDGNKDSTDYSGSTGWGIRTLSDDATNQTKNINIDNVWSYNHKASGIEISSKNVNVSNIHCYNNGFHGFATGSTTHVECQLSNAVCYDNDGLGIDISDGSCKINGFECYGNGSGGMKTSSQLVRLQAENGYLHDNTGQGFRQTSSPADSYVYLDNVITENNTKEGFRFSDSDIIEVGRITSISDDTSGTATGLASIYITNKIFRAESIVVKGASQDAIYGSAGKLLSIGNLVSIGNTGKGFNDAGFSNYTLNIDSGYVYNNGTIGLDIKTEAIANIKGIRFGDDQGTATQTIDIRAVSNAVANISECDFTDSDSIMIQHSTAKVTVRDCKGINNEASGTETQSGDGAQTAFTIAHGLDLSGIDRVFASPKVKVSVSASDADAAGDFYVDYDTTNITITYPTAPGSGTDNLSWNWAIEYYAFDDR